MSEQDQVPPPPEGTKMMPGRVHRNLNPIVDVWTSANADHRGTERDEESTSEDVD